MTAACQHARIRTWVVQDDGKPAGLWACADCGHKFVPLDIAQETDAERWRGLLQHASLGFHGSPSWAAEMRLPVYDADDTTITALVDRAMSAE
jgi:hypothetical protein